MVSLSPHSRSSAVGSAPRSGRGGRAFESPLLDKKRHPLWWMSCFFVRYCKTKKITLSLQRSLGSAYRKMLIRLLYAGNRFYGLYRAFMCSYCKILVLLRINSK